MRDKRKFILIIETDLGRDPDDLFAICYLIAAGVDIRAILISPGDPDQVAVAKFLCSRTGLKIPVGVSHKDRTKRSSGGVHYDLLDKYNYPLEAKHDGMGADILGSLMTPDTDLFVIGPVTSVGTYLKFSGTRVRKATMQGGFLGYHQHDHYCPRIPKFNNKTWVPTFNLNGDREAGEIFLRADIMERRMVGKNVCHTVVFVPEMVEKLHPRCEASRLFREAAELYFRRHPEKKFHDPTAACLHLHPEIGTWVRGRTVKMKDGWGTELDPSGDYICAAVDYEQLWGYILGYN